MESLNTLNFIILYENHLFILNVPSSNHYDEIQFEAAKKYEE
jgi:hypothetical protein